MKNLTIKTFLIILGFLFIQEASAYSFEFSLGCDMEEYFFIENNFHNKYDVYNYDHDSVYNIMSVNPNFFFIAGSMISGYLMADFSWARYFDSENLNDADIKLSEAYLDFSFAETSTQVGCQSFQFGRGLIMDSDEPGIAFEIKPLPCFYLAIKFCKVMEQSLIASAVIGYKPGFLERLELFGVFFKDNDDTFADLLNRIFYYQILNYPLLESAASSGKLFWYGMNADLFFRDIYASGITIFQTGTETATIARQSKEKRFDIFSYLINIDLDYNITDRISTGAFLFITSGDLQPGKGDFNAFISPLPYNPRTTIFFQEFRDQMADNGLSLGGITIAGLIAPGLKIDCQPFEKLSAEMTLAILFPEEKLSGSRTWFGCEADLVLSYTFMDRLKLVFEADYFKYGDIFKPPIGQYPDMASRFMLGINAYL